MSNAPTSLGDAAPSNLRLVNETRDLPGSRKEIVSAISDILGLGLVQKLVIEINQPISFTRYVKRKKDDEGPPEVPPETPFEAALNGIIEEFAPEKDYGLPELLFKAFAILSNKGMKPENFFVAKLPALRSSLGVDEAWNLSTLFGVSVLRDDQVPDGVLVLSGTDGTSKFSLRMLIPKRKS